MFPRPNDYIKHSDYLSSSYLSFGGLSAILRAVRRMRPSPAPDLALCSRYHRAIELVGRRWTGAIVFLLLRSHCRFATLRDAIPDITDRMLSERLQELEKEIDDQGHDASTTRRTTSAPKTTLKY